ncbi:hypothetical protein ACF0H5_004341 [Mactra antiquata]
MRSKTTWILIYFCVFSQHTHSMPTSASDFKDPAFDSYFDLSTRQPFNPTTTIDYDLADFDEFGNDPGLYDVAGSPDTVNIDPDADQTDYQGGGDTGMVPSIFEPLYTNTPKVDNPTKASGGISDEKKTKSSKSDRYRSGYGNRDSTTNEDPDQSESQSTSGTNENTRPDKKTSSKENKGTGKSTTNTVDESSVTKAATSSTDPQQSKTDVTEATTQTQAENNRDTSTTPSTGDSANTQTSDKNSENVGTGDKTKQNKQNNDGTNSENNQHGSEKSGSVYGYKLKSGKSQNDNKGIVDIDESSSRDISSESSSIETSISSESESNETKFDPTSSSESENSSGSTSESTSSSESTETNSVARNAKTNRTKKKEHNSSSFEVSDENLSKEERIKPDSVDNSASTELSNSVDSSTSTSAEIDSSSNESMNSISDESGSSSSNESSSNASGDSVSDESGSNEVSKEMADSASLESGGASTNEASDDISADTSTENSQGERSDSISDERIYDSDEGWRTTVKQGSVTHDTDENYTNEKVSKDSTGMSSESPDTSSNEENFSASSDSNYDTSNQDDDDSVSYDKRNQGNHRSTLKQESDISDEHMTSSSQGSADRDNLSDEVSEYKSNKLFQCFTEASNDTDCFLLRSLHSICFSQFSNKCLSGVNGIRKTKLASHSGSNSLRSFDASSESADVDDPFSDSLEASDGSSSDSSSNSLSLETIENLSASYEKASGIFEVIMLIKEACPSICALAESAKQPNDVGNEPETSISPAQDSSESSDEDEMIELSSDMFPIISDERTSGHISYSEPASGGYSSESKSVDVAIQTSSGGSNDDQGSNNDDHGSSNDDSQYSSNISNDYSFEDYSTSDNSSK